MKRDLLAKSLAQMGSKPLIAADAGPKVDESSPRSLKSMSDVLSQVSAQAAQDVMSMRSAILKSRIVLTYQKGSMI